MEAPEIRSPDETPPAPAQRFRLRWSLLTLMLLAALVCVWVTYFRFRLANPQLVDEIEAMEKLARPFAILDPSLVAVVKTEPVWMGEEAWQVYLPEGHRYRMVLVTRDVPSVPVVSSAELDVVAEVAMESGTHVVSFRELQSGAVVYVNGKQVLQFEEEDEWSMCDFSRGGAHYERSGQPKKIEYPATLYRRNFVKNSAAEVPGEPTDGLLLMIETID